MYKTFRPLNKKTVLNTIAEEVWTNYYQDLLDKDTSPLILVLRITHIQNQTRLKGLTMVLQTMKSYKVPSYDHLNIYISSVHMLVNKLLLNISTDFDEIFCVSSGGFHNGLD